jgi:endonuclease/exonuclease/phosphatase (EEP) superfamily protein YafD
VTALLWVVTMPFVLWAALRMTGWDAGYRWAQLVAFTPYVAAAAVVVPVLCLLLRRWAAGLVSLAAAASLVAVVVPRALADGDAPVARGPVLRVLAANLAVGSPPATETVMDLVRRLRPDVLTIQELTPEVASTFERAGLSRQLPYKVEYLTRSGNGSGIFSRFPLRQDRRVIDVCDFPQARAVVKVTGGPEVEVVSVHPASPVSEFAVRCGTDGLRALPSADSGGLLQVLAGDFNATLDHAPMRELLDRGYRDAAAATGQGLHRTWPYAWFRAPKITIDHVFADRRMAIRDFSVHSLSGSDHRAVFADLRLPA